MTRLTGFLLLFFIASQLWAQSVVISGKAVDYSGKEISFYTYSDPVMHQKGELGAVKAGTDGSFALTISISKTIEIYTDIEKYTGTLVVEPGKNYIVTLPPFSPRTVVEASSPYFKPTLYWLGLPQIPNNDLNFTVRSFLTEYNLETVKNTAAIYQNSSKTAVNEIIARLDQKYSGNKSDYFRTLKMYYFAELEYSVHQRDPNYIIDKYFARSPIELQNPAYQRCFESLFSDYLRKESRDYKNRNIIALVNSANFSGLVSLFEGRGYRTEFAELVVVKGLYDGYFTGGFDKKSILNALKQSQVLISYNTLKPIVAQILHAIEELSVGRKAPSFKLVSLLNQTVTLETYQGKFVYLVFFKSSSQECKTEMDSIVSLEKKFRQVLSVVSIATDDNFDAAAKLWKDKGYQWDLLNGSANNKLTENYRANIVPAFYLISPDGTLYLSPAPAPSHEFEAVFLKIFRDYNFNQATKSIKSK
jgi:peroxiredoxin